MRQECSSSRDLVLAKSSEKADIREDVEDDVAYN